MNREIKAVSEALSDYLDKQMYDDESAAQAAIAASDSQYVKGLVGALRRIRHKATSLPEAWKIVYEALQQLPEDLR